VCTGACTIIFTVVSIHVGLMKADLRIPIKDYSRNKKPAGTFQRVLSLKFSGGLSAVVADGLDGTAVVFASGVFGIFVCGVSHKIY